MEKKLSDQVREQVMDIYAAVGNDEMEEDMYSIVLIHTLLEEMDRVADNLRKDLEHLREEALSNDKRLEAEKEELKRKLDSALKENDTLKAKLAGKQLADEW